jgi:acylphosphatase
MVTLVFTGRFEPDSFVDFARHRAARLSLHAIFSLVRTDRIEVLLSGEDDLVDMFEVACSLGPFDCLVDDTRRLSAAAWEDAPR